MTPIILITGSRNFGSPQQDQEVAALHNMRARKAVEAALDKYISADHHVLVHGGARGADYWTLKWAIKNEVTQLVVPARWKKFGKAAGLTRNENMLMDYTPSLVVAFWNGRSNGTKHMIEFSNRRGVRTMVFNITLEWLADTENPEAFPEPRTNY